MHAYHLFIMQIMRAYFQLIDGHRIWDLNLNWVRRQMSIVTQDPILFNIALRDNIAFGDNTRDVSMEEIIEAAKCANIHSFIASLPHVSHYNM